jgi:hypothetical protein
LNGGIIAVSDKVYYTKRIGDASAVFSSRSDSEPGDLKLNDYYYTLDDKRNTNNYRIKRIICLIFGLILIHLMSCLILKYSPLADCSPTADLANEVTKEPKTYHSDLLKILATTGTILATIWAMQSYWRLRYIDGQAEKWRPHENIDEWSDPFTFHVLAESHKQWAELWFCWCVAIFTGGVTYAIYSIHAHPLTSTSNALDWQHVVYNIITNGAS